jgi:uncharacterized protein with NRDE domain
LIHTHEHFGGFSLLLGTMNELWILRSPTKDGLEQQRLKPGIHTITNTDPSTQWPKAAYLERALESLLPTTVLQPMDLLHILAARRPVPPKDPADEWLPEVASTPFIANSTYGTRASTVLLIQRDGHATFVERSFDDQGRPRGDIRETFAIKCD